jgi:hypothetical protein
MAGGDRTSSRVWIPAEFCADYEAVSTFRYLGEILMFVPSWRIKRSGVSGRDRRAVLRRAMMRLLDLAWKVQLAQAPSR